VYGKKERKGRKVSTVVVSMSTASSVEEGKEEIGGVALKRKGGEKEKGKSTSAVPGPWKGGKLCGGGGEEKKKKGGGQSLRRWRPKKKRKKKLKKTRASRNRKREEKKRGHSVPLVSFALTLGLHTEGGKRGSRKRGPGGGKEKEGKKEKGKGKEKDDRADAFGHPHLSQKKKRKVSSQTPVGEKRGITPLMGRWPGRRGEKKKGRGGKKRRENCCLLLLRTQKEGKKKEGGQKRKGRGRGEGRRKGKRCGLLSC